MSDAIAGGTDVKPCGCGKLMVLERTGVQKTLWPPLNERRWKCYGCGAEVTAEDELAVNTGKLRWAIVNGVFDQGEK